MAKEEFGNLIKKVKSNKPEQVIQGVIRAEKPSINANSKKFIFHIEKELLKRLKMKAIEEEKSIKYLINEAIMEYLK
ncbi:ribbon-helix-helix protein, CopG family [Maribacter luteus]|uniref:ribbon-helix-helix protein, CopG family n=1 Tax=Maribacter luteus TaxID=2594478 RepID=UPI00249156A0|nr:ribbon-helix-helix protein, CopG family [Maribacter luteus]